MPITYENCGDEVNDIVKRIAKKFHPDLIKEKITIGCLYASKVDNDGRSMQAVKLHGYPCAATIKKNSLKDRVEGKPDATITIDSLTWGNLSAEERDALIDHELTHLELKRDKNGDVDIDDIGRPKLTIRLHDAQVGIFKSNIERFGQKALDSQIAEKFIDEYGQLLLWAKDKKAVG